MTSFNNGDRVAVMTYDGEVGYRGTYRDETTGAWGISKIGTKPASPAYLIEPDDDSLENPMVAATDAVVPE